jgi:hypothetical protein
MRYQVQMFYLGEWQIMDSAGSARLASLLVEGLREQWAHFDARVRLWDAHEQRAVAIEEVR